MAYGHAMKYRPEDPQWESRDRFLLSHGHYAIAFYAALSTMSGLYVALFVTSTLWLLRGAVLLFGKRSTGAHAMVAAASGRISAEAA